MTTLKPVMKKFEMTTEEIQALKWTVKRVLGRGQSAMTVDPDQVLYLIESYEEMHKLIVDTGDDIKQITQILRENRS
jgi:hypothetical protein